MKTLLTTGDIAAHCQVTYQTANNWIRGGKLQAFRTPGRHHRVNLAEFERFLAEHGMPPYEPTATGSGVSAAERHGSEPDRPQSGGPHAVGPQPGEGGRRRILVVDDDPNIVRLVTRYLSQEGEYELETAADGFEAGVQVYRFQPDLVLLDLMMPDIDGFKVCQRIKATPETQHIKVLVMTGHGSEQNLQAARERGADHCLAKPFRIAELKHHIDRLCGEQSQRRRSMTA